MPVEAFVHEALRYALGRRFVAHCNLGLDDRMGDGMHLQVREVNASAAMRIHRELNALGFREREPL
jgi:hypothetical protein